METTLDSPRLITATSSYYRLEPVLRNACGSAGFLFCPFDAETRGGTTIRHRHQEEPGDTARHNATHAIVSSEIASQTTGATFSGKCLTVPLVKSKAVKHGPAIAKRQYAGLAQLAPSPHVSTQSAFVTRRAGCNAG
jgi:hypothetical protein